MTTTDRSNGSWRIAGVKLNSISLACRSTWVCARIEIVYLETPFVRTDVCTYICMIKLVIKYQMVSKQQKLLLLKMTAKELHGSRDEAISLGMMFKYVSPAQSIAATAGRQSSRSRRNDRAVCRSGVFVLRIKLPLSRSRDSFRNAMIWKQLVSSAPLSRSLWSPPTSEQPAHRCECNHG